jgi:hypothetical protein
MGSRRWACRDSQRSTQRGPCRERVEGDLARHEPVADRAGATIPRDINRLTFPPASKETLICFILFDVRGIALFGRIVVLLVLLD